MTRPTLPHGLLLAALLAPILMPTPASAHAHLQDSQPAERRQRRCGARPPPAVYRGRGPEPQHHRPALRGRAGRVRCHRMAADPAEPKAVLLHLGPTAPSRRLHGGVACRSGPRRTPDGRNLHLQCWLTAAPGQAAAVRAEQPWARATAPQQKVGGAYVTLTSPADDRLVGVSSPVAGRAEVHEMRMDGNVMRMRELTDGLALPAGKPVALAPGGHHIMLMDLKQPLVAGQVIPVQLRFQQRAAAGFVSEGGASRRGRAAGRRCVCTAGRGWPWRDLRARALMDRRKVADAGPGGRARRRAGGRGGVVGHAPGWGRGRRHRRPLPPCRAATASTVTDADFRGKRWMLVYFGYTHCPDACPTALQDMANALDSW